MSAFMTNTGQINSPDKGMLSNKTFLPPNKVGITIKMTCFLTILFVCFACYRIQAQDISKLKAKLKQGGLSEINITICDSTYYISFYNRDFRWNVAAIQAAITKSRTLLTTHDLILLFTEKDIPVLEIELPNDSVHQKFTKHKSSNELLLVRMPNESTVKLLRTDGLKYSEPTRFQIIIYPELFIKNTTMSRIYEIQANIAPALTSNLWKGMRLTAQVIFPVYVDKLYYRETNIRPGFLTLSQGFRLANNYYFRIAMGNFNHHRYGSNLSFHKAFWKNHGSIYAEIGFTGESLFYDGRWYKGKLNTITWEIGTNYYYEHYNLLLSMSINKFINHDHGIIFKCTRYFKETAIGLYGQYSNHQSNGGFYFSIPFPIKQRNTNKKLSINIPRYFDWQYNAATEFYYGQKYDTRPNENDLEHWYNLIYFKQHLKPR